MTQRPNVWARLLCRLSGEVPADTLEAYRRATLAVLDLLEQTEQQRLLCRAEGHNPWTVPPATQAAMLCAWNAFVLQNLGNEFLDADYRNDPATVGYVPPITADQVLGFYAQVEGWLNRGHQAYSHSDYRLDVEVPADLPPWSDVEPCPNAHLHGMLQAMRSVRDHAQTAMQFLDQTPAPTDAGQREQANRIRQLHASATAKARYADDLHGSNPSRDVHERVEPYLKEAVEQFYRLGQWIAMPSLASPPTEAAPAPPPESTALRLPLPGEPDFDPWCLTDPPTRSKWKADPEAREAIAALWRLDPDPGRTLAILAEIRAAVSRGDVVPATDRYGKPLGHFFCCPWGTVYSVVRSVVLGGQRLGTLQQFVFDVTAEGMNLGNPFRRRILVGDFRPTTRTEYGDPNEEPDH
jgi:hypothetical protein